MIGLRHIIHLEYTNEDNFILWTTGVSGDYAACDSGGNCQGKLWQSVRPVRGHLEEL